MASILETPSRIWRRIEAEGDRDMPSLPSVPAFDDSADISSFSDNPESNDHQVEEDPSFGSLRSPIHSTPAASSHYASTMRAASSTSSATRFANSLARSVRSRSSMAHSSASRVHPSYPDSFEVSAIPSLPDNDGSGELDDLVGSTESAPEEYVSGKQRRAVEEEEEPDLNFSLADALQSISRDSSPFHSERGRAPKEPSYIEYEMPLKSSPQATPFSTKFRHVSMRRGPVERTRTPSLSRTTPSPASSPANSTPRSGRSQALDRSTSASPEQAALIPLPPSNAGSPAPPRSPEPDASVTYSDLGSSVNTQSMDITEAHVSPIRQPADSASETEEAGHEESLRQEDDPSGHTFSTDDGPTPYANRNLETLRSPEGLASAFSSPAPSMATPTPSFPRPRARFEVPDERSSSNDSHEEQGEPQEQGDGDEQESLEEPLTPQTRRRSFLLSVINSTTRPRMKFPTPHPRNRIPPDTPSIMDATPLPAGRGATLQNQSVTLQSAFAGTTPRPRFRPGARMSHPLAQTFTASSSPSESESVEGTDAPDNAEHVPWTTPAGAATVSAAHLSPYDEALLNGGASFVSTASSHDLTTHPRANTSFDPAMGFGGNAPGHGVGRFNAGKLNTYLHGLNRRLQEENEALMERLHKLEEAQGKSSSNSVPPTPAAVSASSNSSRRQSGGGRRLSAISSLGDLPEEAAESWMEEKAELEEMVETFKNEVEQCMKEKEVVEKALEQESLERARDKERWKERMSEVQAGVQAIVADLEGRLHAAEADARGAEEAGLERVGEMEKRLQEIQAQRDDVAARAEKAESVLATNLDLGSELRDANDRISSLMGDLRNANSQIKELEEEVVRSEEFIDGLEKDLTEQKKTVAGLQETLEGKNKEISAQRKEVRHLEQAQQKTEEELNAAKIYIAKLEEDAHAAVEQYDVLEKEFIAAQDEIKRLKMLREDNEARGEELAKEAGRAAELARQLEEALEAAEKKMGEDEDEMTSLRGKLAALERDKERQKELSTRSADHSSRSVTNAVQTAAHEAEIEALEQELDEATKEIVRLHTLLSQSPARKAVDKAKDAKIEMLEQENEALSERIKTLRTTMTGYQTPSKIINNSGISPMHRRALSVSIRTPKTPGGPLRDMSWLNSTTGDYSTSPLVAEISRLQRELDLANESIDDKLDKLEDAGLGVVGLTKKLEDARSRIRSLEDQIARLSRREERRLRRLERARCQKCLTKIDVRSVIHLSEDESLFETVNDTLPTEPPTPPTKTSDALRANLRTVTTQLQETRQQWENEKRKLLGEKAVLQDAANRLNVEVREAKAEANKASEAHKADGRLRQDIQVDLEKARLTISELEGDLKAERARLRAMSTEQGRVNREKEQVFNQLKRTEADIEEVRVQLQTCKKENKELEKELRVNANVEQRARLLEIKITENAETMEQLREERALLTADHKELQQRYSEVSEHANKLLDKEAASRKTHDGHRHQLDLYLGEINDLRRALADRSGDLHRVEAEKLRIAIERSDVAHTVAALEADLKRVRENAEAFGRDLKELRLEKERLEKKNQEEQSRAERAKKQTQTQIRLLTEQLDGQRAKTLRAREELDNHVCAMGDRQLSALKLQHNREAKGLIVQIRYLKAKFTRESSLRFDLAYQKHYLLVLLNKFEKSERTISAAIARIGFPVTSPVERKRRKLKHIAQTVIFIARIK
ncbi:hypothetical protein GYMLUDRAFT_174310 [Collybiopsis luxurians FD-317 M1]|uniref:Pericentrin/AKAP-450 centrosomal targeting domain-containing protein n=1 Tax=Collybiopsis luxurians FD-317 M1 TaxID=944289 RepID=A0A0D0BN18_9AGAR|nr:hypothetical protein GYMLUDRAFT_174310 [Collybiopsis luxurians FD-317 M1]